MGCWLYFAVLWFDLISGAWFAGYCTVFICICLVVYLISCEPLLSVFACLLFLGFVAPMLVVYCGDLFVALLYVLGLFWFGWDWFDYPIALLDLTVGDFGLICLCLFCYFGCFAFCVLVIFVDCGLFVGCWDTFLVGSWLFTASLSLWDTLLCLTLLFWLVTHGFLFLLIYCFTCFILWYVINLRFWGV